MQGQNELRAFFELVRRRRWMLIRSVMALMIIAIAYLWVATPKYQARTLVLVDQAQLNLLPSDPLRDVLPTDNADVESEVEILRSSALSLDVIGRTNLLSDPEYAYEVGLIDSVVAALGLNDIKPETPNETLGRVLAEFQENTSVQRKGLTYVISISVSSDDPAKAAILANTLAATYIERQEAAKVAQSLVAIDRLTAQIAAATAGIETAATALDKLYAKDKVELLTERLSDLETQASLQVANSRIMSQALPPVEPSSPRTALILAVAMLGGALLGLGLIFFKEIYEDAVTAPAQLSELADAPVATTVPVVSRGFRLWQSVSNHIVTKPLMPFSDAIRRLKASVDQNVPLSAYDEDDGQVVLVTSAMPGEGKTTLALALARVYAQSGARTLLIDADLRKPRVHKYAGKRSKTGLAEYLRNPDKHDLPVVNDPKTGLAMMVGSRDARLQTDDLAGSELFSRIVDATRQSYDMIIVDTAPLMPAADARYIARHADAVLLAVRYGSTRQPVIRSAAEALRDAMPDDASLFTVLNQYRSYQRGNEYAAYYGAGQSQASMSPRSAKVFGS